MAPNEINPEGNKEYSEIQMTVEKIRDLCKTIGIDIETLTPTELYEMMQGKLIDFENEEKRQAKRFGEMVNFFLIEVFDLRFYIQTAPITKLKNEYKNDAFKKNLEVIQNFIPKYDPDKFQNWKVPDVKEDNEYLQAVIANKCRIINEQYNLAKKELENRIDIGV